MNVGRIIAVVEWANYDPKQNGYEKRFSAVVNVFRSATETFDTAIAAMDHCEQRYGAPLDWHPRGPSGFIGCEKASAAQ